MIHDFFYNVVTFFDNFPFRYWYKACLQRIDLINIYTTAWDKIVSGDESLELLFWGGFLFLLSKLASDVFGKVAVSKGTDFSWNKSNSCKAL